MIAFRIFKTGRVRSALQIIGVVFVFLLTAGANAATYYLCDFDRFDLGRKELIGGQIDIVDNPRKDTVNSSDKVAQCRVNQGGKRAEYSSQRLPTREKRRRPGDRFW